MLDVERLHRWRNMRDDIEGWFSPPGPAIWDAFLRRQASQSVSGNVLEIGVFHGLAASLLAAHLDPARESLVLVDKWLKRESVCRALSKMGWDPDVRTHLLEADSLALKAKDLPLAREPFRWIHVDGEHTARAVRNDLRIANQLLAAEGVVCVDDAYSADYPQVTTGLMDYLSSHPKQFRLFGVGFRKAYLARPAAIDGWYRYCRDQLPAALAERGVRVEIFKTSAEPESVFGFMHGIVGPPRLRGPDWDPERIPI